MNRGAGLLLVAVVVVTGAGLARPSRLEVAGPDGVVWSQPIDAGERFDVAFIHSQEKTPFVQHYLAGVNRTIDQDSVSFGSYGAGMPLAPVVFDRGLFTARVQRRLAAVAMLNSRAARIRIRFRGRDVPIDQCFDDFESFEIRIR